MTLLGNLALVFLFLAGTGLIVGFTIAGVAVGIWVWRRLLGKDDA